MVEGVRLGSRLLAVLAVAGVVGVVSCGGVQIEDPEQAGTAGDDAGSGGRSVSAVGGRGGNAVNNGTGGSGAGGGMSGQGGRGGTGTGGRGSGGSAGKGGSSSGTAGRGEGGSSAAGGNPMGQAGESEGGAAGEGERPNCVGSGDYTVGSEGYHCDSTWSYAQGGEMIKVEGATTIEDCMAACNARSDCTAVSDFFALRAGFGCGVNTGSCKPVVTIWAQEDGGLDYRKVCPSAGACTMEFLGYDVRCNDVNTAGVRVPGATTRAECEDVCLADPDCVSVYDYTYLDDVIGCWLNVGPCGKLVESYEDGIVYRKICD